MTLRQLAANNVKGSRHRYLAYFLSCTFSVMIFYIFLSFILHPAVVSGHILGGAGEAVRQGLIAAEVIILIFSFVFIFYSTNAFLLSRKKEFGLLTLLGMTQRQQRRMVLLENLLTSLLAMACGLLGGIVFSKLFFMAMSVLLQVDNPIYFYVSSQAVLLTIAVFAGLFLLLSVVAVLQIRQSTVRQLLYARGVLKPLPRNRPFVLILGILLLAAGYALAWHTYSYNLLGNMFPILGLVIAGTYLVVSYGGVALCRWLQRRQNTYYRGTNMLTLNRLTFRLRDNARIIFISAITIAVVCTALGTVNTFLQNVHSMAFEEYAFAASFKLSSEADPNLADTIGEQVAVAWEKDLGERVDWLHLQALPAHLISHGYEWVVAIVAQRDYARTRQIAGHLPRLDWQADKSYLLEKDYGGMTESALANGKIIVNDKMKLDVPAVELVDQSLLYTAYNHATLVVPDAIYDRLASALPANEVVNFYGYETRAWKRMTMPNAADTIRNVVPDGSALNLMCRADMYMSVYNVGALTMFIGVFVSFLFFIASGSLLYFKLFTEIEDDRRQFATLQDMGITQQEKMRIVNRELGVLFFLPVGIGAVHAGFALKTLSNLIPVRVIVAGAMVAAVYLALQSIYFFLARAAYLRQLQEAA